MTRNERIAKAMELYDNSVSTGMYPDEASKKELIRVIIKSEFGHKQKKYRVTEKELADALAAREHEADSEPEEELLWQK